jgi:hypothetical protein
MLDVPTSREEPDFMEVGFKAKILFRTGKKRCPKTARQEAADAQRV